MASGTGPGVGAWLPAVGMAAALALSSAAYAAPRWPPAAEATIRPGVQLITDNSQCTANFIFYDGTAVYLGYSAHCATVDPEDSGPVHFTAPCGDPSVPLGTPVQIEGATRPGRLVYSSHETMHRIGEADEATCRANDFAIAQVDPADTGKVNPTIPLYGGPTGLRQGIPAVGEKVLSYGNSGLRQGIEELKPREGVVTNEATGGWEFAGYFATPAVFGDSGSAAIDAAGSATGVVNSISSFPPGSNVMASLSQALAYMRRHTGLTMRLATGTEPFAGPLSGPGAVDAPPPQPDPQPEPQTAPPPPPPPAPAQPGQPPAGASGRELTVRLAGRPPRAHRISRRRGLRLPLGSKEPLRDLALELRSGRRVVAKGRLAALDGRATVKLRVLRRVRRGLHTLRVRAGDGRTAALRVRIR